MAATPADDKLEKELGLVDVFAIAVGAMFSSGFFLLPGLAAAGAGPGVVLSYLLAGLLVVPALASLAELSTAMPRAGGAYYFLDRSLGPVFGTVGGLGTWVAQVLKSAFALVGIGAYLTLLTDFRIDEVTAALTVGFVVLNIVGAKETTRLQRLLVWILIGVVGGFVLAGFGWTFDQGAAEVASRQLTPFLPEGIQGVVATVGLVFVSYAGLTKVAGIAEEVKDPDRNIPLGMMLSLVTATALYVLGVFVMVAVLEPSEFREDLTPVATATEAMLGGTTGTIALVLVVTAAFASFASTANAGIMSASRYLLAMARDDHVWPGFARLGRFRTPTLALIATGLAILFSILAFDVEGVAKLASAFLLLVFALVNLAVIVMRESWIEEYEPGFRSPLYPWLQIAGFLIPFVLIAQMGWLAILFVVGVTAASLVWYHVYVRDHLVRQGAIYHVFERLGRERYPGLERELRQILEEKGVREVDQFAEAVAGAYVLDARDPATFETVVREVSEQLSEELPVEAAELAEDFLEGTRMGLTAISECAVLPHVRLDDAPGPRLVAVRSRSGVTMNVGARDHTVQALFFLVSPREHPGRHLQLLAQLAGRVEEEGFLDEWLTARNPAEIRAALLRERSILTIRLGDGAAADAFADRMLRELSLPEGVLVALVRRERDALIPSGGTRLRHGDLVTFIGLKEGLRALRERFGAVAPASSPDGDSEA